MVVCLPTEKLLLFSAYVNSCLLTAQVEYFAIEGLRAKRAYIAFLADFHFLQDRADFWQTDLF